MKRRVLSHDRIADTICVHLILLNSITRSAKSKQQGKGIRAARDIATREGERQTNEFFGGL